MMTKGMRKLKTKNTPDLNQCFATIEQHDTVNFVDISFVKKGGHLIKREVTDVEEAILAEYLAGRRSSKTHLSMAALGRKLFPVQELPQHSAAYVVPRKIQAKKSKRRKKKPFGQFARILNLTERLPKGVRDFESFLSFLTEYESKVIKLYVANDSYSEISHKLDSNGRAVDNAIMRVRKKISLFSSPKRWVEYSVDRKSLLIDELPPGAKYDH